MPDFLKATINDETLIRGAARLLWAGSTVSFPTSLSQVVNLSTFDAMSGWNDLGATKTGIQVSVNNTEEQLDVDQVFGSIATFPVNWEVSVQTALAEAALERMQVAWEGEPVVTVSGEKVTQFGVPQTYIERKLAVMFQRPSGKIRGFLFRKVFRAPQESTVTFNKTGEQQTIPVRFNCLPDLSIAEVRQRIFQIRDQV